MGNAANYMGSGQGRDENVTFQGFWKNLPLAYKFWLITQFALLAVQLIFGLGTALAFQPWQPQYFWTFFMSMFWEMPGLFGLIDSFFVFFFLLQIFPEMQKRLSTLFMIIDPLLHCVLINSCTFLVSWILSFGFQLPYYTPYGLWWPLIIVYSFINNYRDPNALTRCCCCPFLLERRYVPWLVGIFSIIMIGQGMFWLQFVIAILIGYIEGAKLYKHIFRIPMSIYFKLEKWTPNFVNQRSDYVKVNSVANQLRYFSLDCQDSAGNNPPPADSTGKINANNLVVGQNKVEVIGKGVSIGSSSNQEPVNARSVWLRKAEEIQVEPKIYQNDAHFIDPIIAFGSNDNFQRNQNKTDFDLLSQDINSDMNASKNSDYQMLTNLKNNNLKNKQDIDDMYI